MSVRSKEAEFVVLDLVLRRIHANDDSAVLALIETAQAGGLPAVTVGSVEANRLIGSVEP